MELINWWAVLVTTVMAFVLGGLWYGPLFGQAWLSAIGKTEDIVIVDLAREPDAARAEHTALIVEADARADVDVLRLFDLVLEEARLAVAVFDAVFLQRALASLVADRAV